EHRGRGTVRADPVRIAARRLFARGDQGAGRGGPDRDCGRDHFGRFPSSGYRAHLPHQLTICHATARRRAAAMAKPRRPWYIGTMSFDPRYAELRRRRFRQIPFRPIPVRMLVPNLITLLAICAGLTAIRLSTEGRMELAVGAIVFAAALDGIDGRIARMIKG